MTLCVHRKEQQQQRGSSRLFILVCAHSHTLTDTVDYVTRGRGRVCHEAFLIAHYWSTRTQNPLNWLDWVSRGRNCEPFSINALNWICLGLCLCELSSLRSPSFLFFSQRYWVYRRIIIQSLFIPISPWQGTQQQPPPPALSSQAALLSKRHHRGNQLAGDLQALWSSSLLATLARISCTLSGLSSPPLPPLGAIDPRLQSSSRSSHKTQQIRRLSLSHFITSRRRLV